MNKKGFTLTELLATIAILALIITIAVPAIQGVSSRIRNSQRDNIIKDLEVKASRYAFDTGKTIIFIEELIKNGYVDGDDDDENLFDPVTSEKLNCYVIEMTKNGDYYSAKFIQDKNYQETDGSCDMSKLVSTTNGINIQVINNNSVVSNTNEWLKGEYILKAVPSTSSINIDCVNGKCLWTSNSGYKNEGTTEIDINNIQSRLDTNYTFQYTISIGNEVKRYTSNINLKIDNASPIIYDDQITVSDRLVSKNRKKIVISATDEGSGIMGYYLAKNTEQSCNSNSITFQNSNTFWVEGASSNGNYLICVKDKVGNISTYSGLTISHMIN